jgi:LacI family transcriptional regulator
MAKKVTIYDIAERAGVSYQTVSRVVNKRPDVSKQTRARVEEAIRDSDYVPSSNAQSLRNDRTKTIGLIVPDSANPFFAEIAKGVEDAGFEAGYAVILCNSNMILQRELAYLHVLESKGVDGIIFIATTAAIKHIEPIVQRGIPVVIFYRNAGNLNVDTFRIDNFGVGNTAGKYLLNLGHRKIACIMPASCETPSMQRVEGFVQALRANKVRADPALMLQGDNKIASGEDAVSKLIKQGKTFTAIYSTNDAMAIGAIRALHHAGIRIPQEVSIIGTDDLTLASYSEPPLTTIHQPTKAAGQQAIQYLVERIEGKFSNGPREVVLETRLIQRGSCTRRGKNVSDRAYQTQQFKRKEKHVCDNTSGTA